MFKSQVAWSDGAKTPLSPSEIKRRVYIAKKKMAKITDEYIAAVSRAFTAACVEWVKTASALIPAWTGMTQGSLLPVSRALMDEELVDYIHRNINKRKVSSRKGYTLINGTWVVDGVKNWQTGERIGARSYHVALGTRKGRQFYFKYEVLIWQWEYLDEQWGALDAADAAFEKTLRIYTATKLPEVLEAFLNELRF